MNFENKIKELSCEELEIKRGQLAKFIFSDFRKIDPKILSISIDKLTIIENEIEYREEVLRDMISDPQSTIIIDWEEDIREQMEQFYK